MWTGAPLFDEEVFEMFVGAIVANHVEEDAEYWGKVVEAARQLFAEAVTGGGLLVGALKRPRRPQFRALLVEQLREIHAELPGCRRQLEALNDGHRYVRLRKETLLFYRQMKGAM